MPHRPKFDEPWMDELDGHDCVQKSVTLGVKAAMVGKCCVLDDSASASLELCTARGCTKFKYFYSICFLRVNDVLQ